MAGGVTLTNVEELTQSIIDTARLVIEQTSDLRTTVTRRSLSQGKNAVDFPLWANPAAATLTEGTDLTTVTDLTTTAVTVTPGEVGLLTTFTDKAQMGTPIQTGAQIGVLLGNAIRANVNQTIYALFDGFSTAIGTTNVDITEALIRQAVGTLMNANAPAPYYLPVTAHVHEDILALYSSSTNVTSTGFREGALGRNELPEIYGVIPVLVSDLVIGTGAGERNEADTKTAVYSAAAIGYVEGWDIRIETERNASLRAWEIVATANYAVAEIKDDYGVELLVDNAD